MVQLFFLGLILFFSGCQRKTNGAPAQKNKSTTQRWPDIVSLVPADADGFVYVNRKRLSPSVAWIPQLAGSFPFGMVTGVSVCNDSTAASVAEIVYTWRLDQKLDPQLQDMTM